MNEKYLTVTQLNRYIHRKFTQDPYLREVYLRGEISNYNARRQYQNQYFKIKDEHSVIQAIMFKNVSSTLKFSLEEGMSVLIKGRVDVYEPYGTYQIYVDEIQPDGIGDLYLAYEQTKKKLAAEGLFDAVHKKEIPKFPETIGVITSPSGAAIKDIQTTITRRYPLAKVLLYPTLVQGKKAAADIEKNIIRATINPDLDIIIVARGGGSFEDLFPFSEEKVVRAVAQSSVPIISAIGHETDLSLAELASDLRAPTPTAAAEMATPDLKNVIEQILRMEQRMTYIVSQFIQRLEEQLTKIQASYIFQQPERLYQTYDQKVDLTTYQLKQQMNFLWKNSVNQYQYLADRLLRAENSIPIQQSERSIAELTSRLQKEISLQMKTYFEKANSLNEALSLLSPYRVLQRGYSIVTQNNRVVKESKNLEDQQSFEIQFSEKDIISAKKVLEQEGEEK